MNHHRQVILSAVVGRTKGGDEEGLAFVQVASDDMPEVDELRAFLSARLAGYKRPKHIVLATALPAAPTGKLLEHKMIAHFAEALP